MLIYMYMIFIIIMDYFGFRGRNYDWFRKDFFVYLFLLLILESDIVD